MEQHFNKTSTNNLKDAGLKATLPRLKVLEILQNATEKHMSAEDIYQQMFQSGNNVGLATVYRVLTQFEHAGLVIRHNFDIGHSLFELSVDDHHDHLQCITCGKIIEFYDDTLEKTKDSIANNLGFVLEDHSLILYGGCQNKTCENRNRKNINQPKAT